MRRNDGAEIRRKRINELKQEIVKIANAIINSRKNDDEKSDTNVIKNIQIPMKRFVACQSIETGLTPTKIREYLKTIDETGFIMIEEEMDAFIFNG